MFYGAALFTLVREIFTFCSDVVLLVGDKVVSFEGFKAAIRSGIQVLESGRLVYDPCLDYAVEGLAGVTGGVVSRPFYRPVTLMLLKETS